MCHRTVYAGVNAQVTIANVFVRPKRSKAVALDEAEKLAFRFNKGVHAGTTRLSRDERSIGAKPSVPVADRPRSRQPNEYSPRS